MYAVYRLEAVGCSVCYANMFRNINHLLLDLEESERLLELLCC